MNGKYIADFIRKYTTSINGLVAFASEKSDVFIKRFTMEDISWNSITVQWINGVDFIIKRNIDTKWELRCNKMKILIENLYSVHIEFVVKELVEHHYIIKESQINEKLIMEAIDYVIKKGENYDR